MSAELQHRADKALEWMTEKSFPFWAARGLDPRGGFRERLALDGTPIEDPDSRVRLQGRQTICFAMAERLGWQPEDAGALVERGLDTLIKDCQRPDGLYGKRVVPGEGLKDADADLYDTAFALLGFSAALEAGHTRAGGAGAAVSQAIDTHLKRPVEEGGYIESLPTPSRRLQNPHMHLFESSMAWYQASGDKAALARAADILALLEDRFTDPETGYLSETFTLDWQSGADNRFEAGHHYEWVWLLGMYARLTQTTISPAAKRLYAAGKALTHESGRIALSHNLDGTVRENVYRTWGQTEALKAHLTAIELGWADAQEAAIQTFDVLWADHIAAGAQGGWVDRVTAEGKADCVDMTSATGYHIYIAIEDLVRVAGQL